MLRRAFDLQRVTLQVGALGETGEQEVACMLRRGRDWSPAPFPVPMLLALRDFVEEPALAAALDDALAFQRAAG